MSSLAGLGHPGLTNFKLRSWFVKVIVVGELVVGVVQVVVPDLIERVVPVGKSFVSVGVAEVESGQVGEI